MTNATITTERVPGKHGDQLHLVKRNGTIIGMISKYPDRGGVWHPWKAFKGIGMAAEFLGTFYPAGNRGIPDQGGRAAAVAAIVASV